MTYLALRHLHILCVGGSIALFVLRSALSLSGVDWRSRWPVLRWLPHLNDSVLMAAGVSMMVWSQQYPGMAHPWLAVKLALLLAYIGVGKQALRPGVRRPRRLLWVLAALFCVGAMVAVATTRWPV